MIHGRIRIRAGISLSNWKEYQCEVRVSQPSHWYILSGNMFFRGDMQWGATGDRTDMVCGPSLCEVRYVSPHGFARSLKFLNAKTLTNLVFGFHRPL